MNSVTVS